MLSSDSCWTKLRSRMTACQVLGLFRTSFRSHDKCLQMLIAIALSIVFKRSHKADDGCCCCMQQGSRNAGAAC